MQNNREPDDDLHSVVEQLEARLDKSLADNDAFRREVERLTAELEQAREAPERAVTDLAAQDPAIFELDQRVQLLRAWLEHICYGLLTLLASRRWRIGNRLVGTLGKLFGRPSNPPWVHDVKATIRNFETWREQQEETVGAGSEAAIYRSASLRSGIPETSTPHYDVVFFANIDWAQRFQRPQQIAKQFAAHGHRVFYVVASDLLPIWDTHRFRAREVTDNVFEVRLSGAGQVDRYADVLDRDTGHSFERSIEALREHFNIIDAVCVVHLPFWAPLALALRERWRWATVYDCMDEWRGFPGIGKQLLTVEEELVQAADLVTVSASALEEKWRGSSRACLLVRNGVESRFFDRECRSNQLLRDVPHPIIGYYGAIADWIDLGLLDYLAAERPDWSFVLIGDIFVGDLRGLDTRKNVHIPGRKPYEEMPRYLYHFDVCVIPFRLNEVTHAVDPVKLYEFFAGGKPIVATPLRELSHYADHLYFGRDPDSFLQQIEVALREDDATLREERRTLATQNDWKLRYDAMHQKIVEIHPKVSIIVVAFQNLALTRACLDSILENTTHPNYELIVIDNASDDATPEFLREFASETPQLEIRLNEENRGFAAACNQGLEAASGEYMVLMNNDTVVPRGWLNPLLRHLQDPKIGMVGPVTNFAGNEARIEIDYEKISDMPAFTTRRMREHEGVCFDIKSLAMFCVMMRRCVYESVGPLDEEFEVGMFEDDDYSLRVRQAGFRTVCAEDAFVHHVGQAAFKSLLASGEYQRIWDKNQAHFEEKWGPWVAHQARKAAS